MAGISNQSYTRILELTSKRSMNAFRAAGLPVRYCGDGVVIVSEYVCAIQVKQNKSIMYEKRQK